MSYYTKFKIKLKLKSDTPQKIIDALEYSFNGMDENGDNDEDAEKYFQELFGSYKKVPDVFLASRWSNMFGNAFNEITYDDGQCSILLDSEFQNRDEEINKFLYFIGKYVDGSSVKDGKKVGSIETEYGDYRDIVIEKSKKGSVSFTLKGKGDEA